VTLRLALVGCGAAAQRLHMPALRAAGAAIACFASRRLSSAEAAASEWGGGALTDDWRTAVTRDDVDAVVVCAPNDLHAPVAIEAAKAGKHVLVEKPMATSLEDADAMIAAAAGSGVLLVPAHNARFAPGMAAARVEVADGTLGQVRGFHASLVSAGPLAWSPDATWFLDPDGGGALLDLGIHLADVLRFVVGDITEVSATTTGIPAMTAAATLRTASGAIGTMNVSWEAPAGDARLDVRGSLASLRAGIADAVLTYPDGRTSTIAHPPADGQPYAGFVRACAGEGPVPVTAEDGRAALAIIIAAQRSVASGRTVKV
jgi:UDP-N-acetylglucosamine 3-dehydrogenase